MDTSLVIKIFLTLVIATHNTSGVKLPRNSIDYIDIKLETDKNIEKHVQIDQRVNVRCPFEQPIWYRNGLFVPRQKKTKGVRLDQIRKQDAGEYSCRSDLFQWANVTIIVDTPSLFPNKIEIQSLVAENLQLAEENEEHEDQEDHDENERTGLDDKEAYGTMLYQEKDGKPEFKRKNELHKLVAKPSGNMFRFRCVVGGNPEPNITWTKNGKEIERRMGKVKQTKYAITLEELVPDDSGLYKCEACNEYGCIDWTSKLEVQDSVNHIPIFKYPPQNRSLTEGDSTIFNCTVCRSSDNCTVLSDRETKISWNYTRCTKYGGCESNSFEIKRDDENPEILKLDNITYEDEGWYSCVAKNTLGETFASAYLSVVDEFPVDKIPQPKLHPYVNLIAGLLSVIFFICVAIFFVTYKKMKHEKMKHRAMERVNAWTKKVIVLKPGMENFAASTDSGLQMPI
uniref:CSON012956 protein n=1 Tax=Culicoides sonorensis TaxID=179676 RepID=A0A336M7H5_CULSO